MTFERSPAVGAETASVPSTIERAHGRQILFYAAGGLLAGTFSCSRCGGSGRHPDVIEHDPDCSYRRPAPTR